MDKHRNNIVIVEPSVIIYEGLSTILLQEGRHQCSTTHFDTLEEIIPELQESEIDMVIINPALIRNNVDFFIQLKMNNSSIQWIGFVYAFFEKDILSLFDDVIQITDAPTVITDILCRLMTSEHRVNKISAKEQLSQREIDVLKLLVQGLLNKEIADELNISTHTVISHRKNIVQKTGIKSQAGLTIYAISNKLINIENY